MKNKDISGQQGFVLAIALILMLLVGLVVMSSFERSGTEQRTATSSLHIASLQAAAEAGLHRVRKGVEEKLKSPPDDFPSDIEDICKEFLDNEFSDNSKLVDLLGEDGKGASDSNAVPIHGSAVEGRVFWWIDATKTTDCVEDDGRWKLMVVSRAFAGEPNNPQAKLALSGDLYFKEESDDAENDVVNNLLDAVPFDAINKVLSLEPDGLDCGGSGGNSAQIDGGNCHGFSGNLSKDSAISTEKLKDFVGSLSTTTPTSSSDLTNLVNDMSAGDHKVVYVGAGFELSDITVPDGATLTVVATGDLEIGKSVEGVNVVHYPDPDGSVRITSNGWGNQFSGVLYAPSSHVDFTTNGGRATSAIVAKSFEMDSGTRINFGNFGGTQKPESDSSVGAEMNFDFDYDYDMTED